MEWRAQQVYAAALSCAITITAGCGGTEVQDDLEQFGLRTDGRVLELGDWPERVEPVSVAGFEYNGEDAAGPPLFQVRAIVPRPDGGTYVVNGASNQVLSLGVNGSLEWIAGGHGQAPGEFSFLRTLQLTDSDAVIAIDGQRPVANIYARSGELLRTVTYDLPPAEYTADLAFILPPQVLALTADEKLVIRGPESAVRHGGPGLRPVNVPLAVTVGTETARHLMTVPGAMIYERGTMEGGAPNLAAPLRVAGGISSDGRSILWARPDRYELVDIALDGSAPEIVRVVQPRKALTAPLEEAIMGYWRTVQPLTPADMPLPDSLPAFDRAFIGSDGSHWARLFTWGDSAEEWFRYAPTGSASIYTFPDRVRILTASDGSAWGVWLNDLDVEHLVKYDL